MRYMNEPEASEYQNGLKSKFRNDRMWYHQGEIVDITVTTKLENGVEQEWVLNGKVSNRQTRFQEKIRVPYRIRTQGQRIYSIEPRAWTRTHHFKKIRLDKSTLIAFVCSSIKQQGMTKLEATELLWKHWDGVFDDS